MCEGRSLPWLQDTSEVQSWALWEIDSLDYLVILLYFGGIMAIGLWTRKMIKSSDRGLTDSPDREPRIVGC